MRVAVVVPTLHGRKDLFQRCLVSLTRTLPPWPHAELYPIYNAPTAGHAWQQGGNRAAAAGFDYLFLAADDIELRPGWFEAAREKLDRRQLPCPVVYNANGSLQSCGAHWDGFKPDGSPAPSSVLAFLNRELWEAVQPLAPFQRYVDLWISERAAAAGYELVVCRGYEFTHHVISLDDPAETRAYEAWRSATLAAKREPT